MSLSVVMTRISEGLTVRICNALDYDPSDFPFFTFASWLRVGTKYGMQERGKNVRITFGQNGAI